MPAVAAAYLSGCSEKGGSGDGGPGGGGPGTGNPEPVVVVSVDISPRKLDLIVGDSLQLAPTARDAAGREVTGRAIEWSSDDETTATITPSGRVSAVGVGTTQVHASIDSVRASTGITVRARALPPGSVAGVEIYRAAVILAEGSSHQFSALARDVEGNELSGRIAFRRRIAGFNADIWVVNADDGSGAVNLTADHGATNQSSPTWSPLLDDGLYRIAYSPSQGGRGHIWTMRADASDKQQLTSGEVFDDAPTWSPDGDRIVFVRSAVAVFGDLYVLNTYTGVSGLMMPLAGPLAGPQFAPAWSPDGRLVAFASKHTGDHFHIFTVWSDGTLLAQRTFAAVDHGNPAWVTRAGDN